MFIRRIFNMKNSYDKYKNFFIRDMKLYIIFLLLLIYEKAAFLLFTEVS